MQVKCENLWTHTATNTCTDTDTQIYACKNERHTRPCSTIQPLLLLFTQYLSHTTTNMPNGVCELEGNKFYFLSCLSPQESEFDLFHFSLPIDCVGGAGGGEGWGVGGLVHPDVEFALCLDTIIIGRSHSHL